MSPDTDHDLLIRIDTNTLAMAKGFKDHELRIRKLERFMWGRIALASVGASVLSIFAEFLLYRVN